MDLYDDLPYRGDYRAHRPSPSEDAYLLGTMARIDQRATLRGTAAARDGIVVALNTWLDEFDPPLVGRAPVQHRLIRLTSRHFDEVLDAFNPQSSSQWDGLGHVSGVDDLFFTEVTADDIEAGKHDSVGALASRGIATRGILVDLSDYVQSKGDYDERVAIPVEVLQAAIEKAGVCLETGDVLLIHTGYVDWYRRLGQERREVLGRARASFPGLDQGTEMARFLWNAGLAAIVSDSPGVEAFPVEDANSKLHHQLIGNLGFWFGELWDLGPLARRLSASERADFMLTSAPFRLAGAVGSPANALAIL